MRHACTSDEVKECNIVHCSILGCDFIAYDRMCSLHVQPAQRVALVRLLRVVRNDESSVSISAPYGLASLILRVSNAEESSVATALYVSHLHDI